MNLIIIYQIRNVSSQIKFNSVHNTIIKTNVANVMKITIYFRILITLLPVVLKINSILISNVEVTKIFLLIIVIITKVKSRKICCKYSVCNAKINFIFIKILVVQ